MNVTDRHTLVSNYVHLYTLSAQCHPETKSVSFSPRNSIPDFQRSTLHSCITNRTAHWMVTDPRETQCSCVDKRDVQKDHKFTMISSLFIHWCQNHLNCTYYYQWSKHHLRETTMQYQSIVTNTLLLLHYDLVIYPGTRHNFRHQSAQTTKHANAANKGTNNQERKQLPNQNQNRPYVIKVLSENML